MRAVLPHDNLALLVENSLLTTDAGRKGFNAVRFVAWIATDPELERGIEAKSPYHDLSLWRPGGAVREADAERR